MKKYIAILSITVLFGTLSCRNVADERYEETGIEEQPAQNNFYAKDSATATTLHGDEEIPRKDLQQWRQKP